MILDEFKGTTKEADLASACTLDALRYHLGVCTDQKGFPDSSVVKNPPANAGSMGQSLGLEDPLEKKMTTHSSILDWKIPWTEEPGRLQSIGL